MYQIIKNSKIFISLSSVLVILSIIAIAVFGLNFGVDFTGGSLLEIRFNDNVPSTGDIQEALSPLNLSSLVLQPAGDDGLILRFQDTSEEKHHEIFTTIEDLVSVKTDDASSTEQVISGIEELRFDSVGPSIGKELKRKSIYSLILVIISIVIYIAWVFRRVSKPVESWKYGVVANVALFHDVIIVLGVFAVAGYYYGIEINTPFVAAILTVLGYSVNDSIVVFDRIRENLPKSEDNFADTVNRSLNESISRSLNTSITTMLVLLSVYFFGGYTLRPFILALSIGVFVGTYSSIFLASPLLVVWDNIRRK